MNPGTDEPDDQKSAEATELFSVSSPEPIWRALDARDDASLLAQTLPVTSENIQREKETSPQLSGSSIGRFRVDSEIARGGMGIIFKSFDAILNREVAIKLLLRTHQNNQQLQRQFMNEARITGRLQHPGIVPIYETGVSEDNRPYFVMKLIHGKTLADLLHARSTVEKETPRFLKIFEQVCHTLSYTHSCGVIHLDIKPANIMVGLFGEVHLMDWGLARVSNELCEILPSTKPESATGQSQEPVYTYEHPANMLPGAVWGTPAYMSPEQARGHCVDVRSDVFGLGGILCEILTGSPPFHGASPVDVCMKAAKGDVDETMTKLSQSECDDVLIRLAMRCLSPNPTSRPTDAMEVASELTLYLESRLQRAERDLERFFDLSLDLFCIAGFDGYFRRVNSNFPRVLGFTEKHLLTRPFLDFVHPDDRSQTVDVMSQLRVGHPVVQFRNRYATVDGLWRSFEWTAKSILEDSTIFAVARDVTDSVRITKPAHVT